MKLLRKLHAMHDYPRRRFMVDMVLVGAVVITACAIAVLRGSTWGHLAEAFAHHVSHWVVEISGAEITATVFARLFSLAE